MNAILYVDRTGCQWAYLSHDFSPWQSVCGQFAHRQKDGIFTQLKGLLRELVRQQEGKNRHPSACVINAQSIKTSTSVPTRSQGIDAGKKPHWPRSSTCACSTLSARTGGAASRPAGIYARTHGCFKVPFT